MPQYVKSVDYRIPLDQLGSQGILFEQRSQLTKIIEDVQRFIPLAKLWAEKPNLVTGLLGTTPMERFLTALTFQQPDKETAQFVSLLAESWVATAKSSDEPLQVGKQLPDLAALDATDPSRLGYYYVPDETDPRRHLLLVGVYPCQNFTSLTGISRTVEAIRDACKQVARQFPEFTIGVTGRPALEADEMRTTDRDSSRAEVIALIVVFIGLVVMLRSAWLALVAEIALGVGIGWTFGYATLTVGELNLLSIVFLIALIGIGMDYLIQILAAYRREARRYQRDTAIWLRVFRYVGPPITTACMGAAGAFLVAVLTDFRGAGELGIIAGGGLLLCLLSGYTVLPALLVLFPPKLKMRDPAQRYGGSTSHRTSWWYRALPAIWVLLLLVGIPFAAKARFNPNLLELQAPNLDSVKLVKKLQTWSAVVLSNDLDVLRRVRQPLIDAPTVARTESLLDAQDNYVWLKERQEKLLAIAWTSPSPVRPQDLTGLAAKARQLADRFRPTLSGGQPADEPDLAKAAAALREYGATLASASASERDRIARRMSLWQEGFVEQLRQQLSQLCPSPLDVQSLPPGLRNHLVSDDGQYALYIYPKDDLWKQEGLAKFVHEVEARVAQVPGSPRVTGIAVNIFHSTNAVAKSFYKSTAYALGLIFLLVLIDLRNIKQTLLAISVVAMGMPMLIALMGLLGISWNFANFFGLPILIGAAHEYGVFLVHRYREVLHNPRRVWQRWDTSDRALLLCAFVTSSSFGFFWALGHHEGLKSLGLVMALGSACSYLAGLLVVRPLLLWWLSRSDHQAGRQLDCPSLPDSSAKRQ
jgi:predicted exporter